ncbi:MAG: phosphate acyltransferase, partial [Oscillospiraceae bacterium]
MKIIIDAMGGDYAPTEIVKGALEAVEKLGVSIVLVGKTEQILRVLRGLGRGELPKGLELANAEDVVDMSDDPVTVIKDRKDSSMVVALNMLRDGRGDGLISAGSTGALITASTLLVKRIHGIRRATLAVEFPTANGHTLIADAGANVECTPEYLLQFAYMGAFYMQRLHDLPKPRVGLLNIGVEETKGLPLQRQTYELLRQADGRGRISFV